MSDTILLIGTRFYRRHRHDDIAIDGLLDRKPADRIAQEMRSGGRWSAAGALNHADPLMIWPGIPLDALAHEGRIRLTACHKRAVADSNYRNRSPLGSVQATMIASFIEPQNSNAPLTFSVKLLPPRINSVAKRRFANTLPSFEPRSNKFLAFSGFFSTPVPRRYILPSWCRAGIKSRSAPTLKTSSASL